MKKSKLPELQVVSFVTELGENELKRMNGGGGVEDPPGDDSYENCTYNTLCPTATACSTSDIMQGMSCTTNCA